MDITPVHKTRISSCLFYSQHQECKCNITLTRYRTLYSNELINKMKLKYPVENIMRIYMASSWSHFNRFNRNGFMSVIIVCFCWQLIFSCLLCMAYLSAGSPMITAIFLMCTRHHDSSGAIQSSIVPHISWLLFYKNTYKRVCVLSRFL